MNKLLVCIAMITISKSAVAKVIPQLEKLRDTQLQCDVVSAVQTQNGQVTKSSKGATGLMETFNQDGGTDYVDTKCFDTPVLDDKGAETTMSFGCLPLDSKHVKKFNSKELVIKRKEYNEVLKIDFTTGRGSHSFRHSGCDWGRKCANVTGLVEFKNCKAK